MNHKYQKKKKNTVDLKTVKADSHILFDTISKKLLLGCHNQFKQIFLIRDTFMTVM